VDAGTAVIKLKHSRSNGLSRAVLPEAPILQQS